MAASIPTLRHPNWDIDPGLSRGFPPHADNRLHFLVSEEYPPLSPLILPILLPSGYFLKMICLTGMYFPF
jgi:hypothetical protein